MTTPLLCDRTAPLNVDAVLTLLQQKENAVSRITKPVGGQVYLFKCDKGFEDWRADGYRWRQNGTSLIPRKSPLLKKIHFDVHTSVGLQKTFQKFAFVCLHDQGYVVVQYIGNCNVADNFPHGNSKDGHNFIGSAPSMKETLRQHSNTISFEDLLLNAETDNVQFQPRDEPQTTYYKKVNAPNRHLARDSLLSLHELAYMLPDYVWSIRTVPDLVVCFGNQALLNVVISCRNLLMSYDTTFKCGDFYLSVLVLKVTSVTEEPCVPIAFVMHERKFHSVHAEMCEWLLKRIPARSGAVLVTDGEPGIVKAFKSMFPKWHQVSCWNHILTDTEVWLQKHGGSAADLLVYKANVLDLLKCSTETEYLTKQETVAASWSEPFRLYYADKLASRVLVSYKGHLSAIGLSQDSITTNMSESLNNVIKAYQGRKEISHHLCLVSLYRLQLFYLTQLSRSNQGFGPYTAVDAEVGTGVVLQLDLPQLNLDEIIAEAETGLSDCKKEHIPAAIDSLASTFRVVHVPELHSFSVSDGTKTHSVKLFPRESCTCPASTTCCHVIKAKNSIGIETTSRKVINLTALRRNNRKAADKKSGRKKPRFGDLSYVAAPDSFAAKEKFVDDDADCDFQTPTKKKRSRVQFAESTPLVDKVNVESDKEQDALHSAVQTPTKKRRSRVQFAESTPLVDKVNVESDKEQDALHSAVQTPTKKRRSRVQFAESTPLVDKVNVESDKEQDALHSAVQTPTKKRRSRVQFAESTPLVDKVNVESDNDQDELHTVGASDNVHVVTSESNPFWLKELQLREHDRQALSTAKEYLNDRVINAAQMLLRNQFPNAIGLLDTLVVAHGKVLSEQQGPVIAQIVHDKCGKGHWMTVSTKNSPHGHVSVYCSMQMMPSDECLYTVSQIVRSTSNTLTVDVMNTCRQRDEGNCGLFAVAFADTILTGKDPCNVVYDESVMRQHLTNCLVDGYLTSFPVINYKTSRRNIVRTKTYPLYCVCRSVYTRSKTMVQCNSCREWWHQDCVGMRDSSFNTYCQPEQPYKCPSCMTKTTACSDEGNRDDDCNPVASPASSPDMQSRVDTAEFWTYVENTRRIAKWLIDHRAKFRSYIQIPIAAEKSNEQLMAIVQGLDGEDARDLTKFVFSNAEDLKLFDDITRNELKTAACVGLKSF